MEIIHYHFKELVSTNDYAKVHFSEFPHDKITLITADHQTKGRGQFGKKWLSPPGVNLYATFCVITEKDPLIFTREMAEALQLMLSQFHIEATIKWPNDLLVKGKKIAGILTETVPLASGQGVAIGIGLNVNMPLELLQTIDQPATSLLVELGITSSIPTILEKLIQCWGGGKGEG